MDSHLLFCMLSNYRHLYITHGELDLKTKLKIVESDIDPWIEYFRELAEREGYTVE